MIVHLGKSLNRAPESGTIEGICVRSFQVSCDEHRWLELRKFAFANESPLVGDWSEADLRREILDRQWWQPERTWLALCETTGQLIGSVTLALPNRNGLPTATVHWLMVHPDWRRRGIGRMLMTHLERAAWNLGHREVRLETHAGWKSAIAFYRRAGYRAPVITA